MQTSERHNDLVGAASSRAYVRPGPRRMGRYYGNSTITTTGSLLSRLVTYVGGQSDRSLVAGWLPWKKV